ncbi:MAG: hypothetical protein JNM69_04475 [Archangium sp.]|nr:hypothetical protein [Archangium sp.]
MRLALLTSLALLFTSQAPEPGVLGQFQTPSGNTFCLVYAGDSGATLECELKENVAKLPARPKDCELDWGSRFSLPEKGKAVRGCYGDTLQGELPKLEYGKPWKVGAFSCEATTKRLRCTNADGHGFELARAAQKLF